MNDVHWQKSVQPRFKRSWFPSVSGHWPCSPSGPLLCIIPFSFSFPVICYSYHIKGTHILPNKGEVLHGQLLRLQKKKASSHFKCPHDSASSLQGLIHRLSLQCEFCGRRHYFFIRHFSFFKVVLRPVLITWQWENSEVSDMRYKRASDDGAIVFLVRDTHIKTLMHAVEDFHIVMVAP